jgi:hypothetical protein
MKMFVIEAYGGKQTTDGPIAHITVNADSAADAIDVVRHSSLGQRYTRFEIVEETSEFEAEEPGIIAESEGPYAGQI